MNKPHRFLLLNSLHVFFKRADSCIQNYIIHIRRRNISQTPLEKTCGLYSVSTAGEINLKFIGNVFFKMYSTTIVTPQIAIYEVDTFSTQYPYKILAVIW
jgi:hypothetical protein